MQPVDGGAVGRRGGSVQARHLRAERPRFVGLVLRDTQVVDIAPANAAFESGNGSAPKLTAPADMKQLIARYDAEWKDAARRRSPGRLERGSARRRTPTRSTR